MGNELVAPFPWFGGKSKHCLDSTPSLLEQSAGDDDEEGEGEA